MNKKISATLIVTFVTAAISLPAANAIEPIRNYFNRSPQERLALQEWTQEKFTSPSTHSKHSFRYIYHEIAAPAGQREFHPNDFAWKLLADPSTIQNNPRISATVIDQAHRTVFFSGFVGFILKVPPENIVATSPEDMSTSRVEGYNAAGYRALRKISDRPEGTIRSPDWILQNTRMVWNEIVVTGIEPYQARRVEPQALVLRCRELANSEGLLNSLPKDEFEATVRVCMRGMNSELVPLISVLKENGFPILGMDFQGH